MKKYLIISLILISSLSFSKDADEINVTNTNEAICSKQVLTLSQTSRINFNICEFNCNLRYAKGSSQWKSCMNSCH